MDYRGVLLIGILSGASVVSAATSCSGPDPGEITFSERPRGSSGELTSGGPGTDGGGPVGEGGTTEGGADGGSSGIPDPVFGTSAFVAGTPGAGAPAKGKPQHSALGAAGTNDPSGVNCVVAGCHLDQRAWAFAGTLYTDGVGAARVKDAEIRVTGPDGKEWAKTFSDVDGNFWIDAPATPLPANSRVGVRTADGKKMNMAGVIGVGQAGCSQTGTCHGAGAGKVYIK